jgi:Domain of unknown function (DUF5666)
MLKRMRYFKIILLLFSIFIMVGGTSLIQAQDDDAIEFPGEINVIDGNIITVGGIAVDISNAIVPGDGLLVGMTVQVIGTRQDQMILATIIVITDLGTPPTPVPPEAEETAEPDVPTPIVPIVVTDITIGTPIIVIEGPVQAINIDSITIFDIDIQVDSADSVLTEIRIGDTVRVEGESSFEGNTIIIVAVNITIVQTTLIIIQNPSPGVVYIPALPPSCKRTKKGNVTCKKKSGKSKKSS